MEKPKIKKRENFKNFLFFFLLFLKNFKEYKIAKKEKKIFMKIHKKNFQLFQNENF